MCAVAVNDKLCEAFQVDRGVLDTGTSQATALFYLDCLKREKTTYK